MNGTDWRALMQTCARCAVFSVATAPVSASSRKRVRPIVQGGSGVAIVYEQGGCYKSKEALVLRPTILACGRNLMLRLRRSVPRLPRWQLRPRRRQQGVHAMPGGEWLLPGKERRHPRVRTLASAAVQVPIKSCLHHSALDRNVRNLTRILSLEITVYQS